MLSIAAALKYILVAAITLIFEFRACPGVNAVGNDHNHHDKGRHIAVLDAKGFFSDFTLSVPFLEILIFVDSHTRRECTSMAADMIAKEYWTERSLYAKQKRYDE